MWEIILGILIFILILSAIVIIHEGGHFLVAKKSGILCYEFAIGMGPVIFQKKIGETVFSIRAIPIGGFVSMAGEDMESDPLNGATLVKLTFDENGKVKEIFALKSEEDKVVSKEQLDTKEFYQLLDKNLIGPHPITPKKKKKGEEQTEEATFDSTEMFVSVLVDGEEKRYDVLTDCVVRYSKKQAIQVAPYDRLFLYKPIWKRFLTVFAGPFMNFVLALVIFFFLGLATGYTNYKTTVIGETQDGTPAYIAGLRDDDKILYIGDEAEHTNYTRWTDISNKLSEYAEGKNFNGSVTVWYERDGAANTLQVKPFVYVQSAYLFFDVNGTNDLTINCEGIVSNMEDLPTYKAGLKNGDVIYSIQGNVGELFIPTTRSEVLAYFSTGDGAESSKFTITVSRDGNEVKLDEFSTFKKSVYDDNNIEVCRVQLGVSPTVTRNIGRLLIEPFKQIGVASTTIIKTLISLFRRNSGISIMDLSGPVGIASATVSMVRQGPVRIFNWMAILSVNIGLMNLLPLPALDGGRLAFILYEAITKKRPNQKVENIIHTVGFIILMVLFVFVAFNDVIKLFK